MNILMHCVYFPPEVGGLESHVFHLCRALVGEGHKVTVVTSRSLPGLPRREVMGGVEVVRTWFPARRPTGWVLHALGSIPEMRRQARNADVIHAQTFSSVVPSALARGAGKAVLVATYHTSHFLRRAGRARWRPILARLIQAADHNLAASVEIARVAEELAPGVRVEALTNGVDTDLFSPGEAVRSDGSRRRVIVPRRLFEKNGVEYFVRAMPYIVERVDAEARIVGDGPERDRLERLARELGVADRVEFSGRRTHEEMPDALRWGEIAVFPSLMEATSVAALEAMACGLPVAASRVGGLPEIVDETVGTLFEPGDPEALAKAVVDLLEAADRGDRGRRARERVVERWSNDRLARRHLEVYRELLGRSRSRGGGDAKSGSTRED